MAVLQRHSHFLLRSILEGPQLTVQERLARLQQQQRALMAMAPPTEPLMPPRPVPSSSLLGDPVSASLSSLRHDNTSSSLLSLLSTGTTASSILGPNLGDHGATALLRPQPLAPPPSINGGSLALEVEASIIAREASLGNSVAQQQLPRYLAALNSRGLASLISALPTTNGSSTATRLASSQIGGESLLPPRAPSAGSNGLESFTDTFSSNPQLEERFPLTTAAMGHDRGRRIRESLGLTYRPPIAPPPNPDAVTLYTKSDDNVLSHFQCVVRKQIELFEAEQVDVETNVQGRNKPIVLGQIGIRCLHCSTLHPKQRARGATYYPAKFSGFYQAAQNMANAHLCTQCTHVPDHLRQQLLILKERKSSVGGGKHYWAECIQKLGVIEDDGILRYKDDHNEKDDSGDDEEGPVET